jgi:transcriptional regulator with XRE-family HTH domain
MSEPDLAAAKRKEKIKIARRRAKVLDMYNRGHTQAEMAGELGVDQSTISRDIRVLSTQASETIEELYDKRLKLECARLITGVDGATKMMWEILDDKNLPPKQRMAAVAILLKCYEARKAFFPAAHSAKEYLEQRKDLQEEMDRMLNDAIKERGLNEPEMETEVTSSSASNTLKT